MRTTVFAIAAIATVAFVMPAATASAEDAAIVIKKDHDRDRDMHRHHHKKIVVIEHHRRHHHSDHDHD